MLRSYRKLSCQNRNLWNDLEVCQVTFSQRNDEINDDGDEFVGDQFLLDPEDAEQLEYDSNGRTTLTTGVEGSMAGLGETTCTPCNTTTNLTDTLHASSVEDMRGLIDKLRGELEDVKVDLLSTKSIITSLERAAEISSSILSTKLAESLKLRKEVESLSITVRALSMSSRNSVSTTGTKRCPVVFNDSAAIQNESDVADDDILSDQQVASTDVPLDRRSPSTLHALTMKSHQLNSR